MTIWSTSSHQLGPTLGSGQPEHSTCSQFVLPGPHSQILISQLQEGILFAPPHFPRSLEFCRLLYQISGLFPNPTETKDHELMRLKGISAKNYRTLEDIVLRFSPDYCTLSGKNNAGKSCIIQLLSHLLQPRQRFWHDDFSLDYSDDRTQWVKDGDAITIVWDIILFGSDDPALITLIKSVSNYTSDSSEVALSVKIDVEESGNKTSVAVDGRRLEERASRDLITKLRSSNCMFLHNSAEHTSPYIFDRPGRRRSYHEVYFSKEEQEKLRNAARGVERQTRRLVKGHKDLLNGLLGKLNEKYDVEFTTFDRLRANDMPFGINLRDKKVEVPIDDWGSGTQNRTLVLMSLLHAKRIKDIEDSEEKITPIVVVEEPESFLHPAAQAEFGGLLQGLAQELGIQIIVSTHSPFMLNRATPESNILLRRRIARGQLQETELADTSDQNWMAPFSEHLGIVSPEFSSWRPLFSTEEARILLVEGDIDKEYFCYIRNLLGDRFGLPADVEIVPYGGKDALKNTALVGFVLRQFSKAFITFDLDAADDVVRSLGRLGLRNKNDYLAIGSSKAGKASIEGLLPDGVSKAVFGRETDLIMQLTSGKANERKEAKNKLKRVLLAEFQSKTNYTDDELKGFLSVGRSFKKAFD